MQPIGCQRFLERVMRIELTTSAWKAEVLPLNYTRIYFKFGAPGRSRTHNLLIRSQTLYPIELRAHMKLIDLVRPRGLEPPRGCPH